MSGAPPSLSQPHDGGTSTTMMTDPSATTTTTAEVGAADAPERGSEHDSDHQATPFPPPIGAADPQQDQHEPSDDEGGCRQTLTVSSETAPPQPPSRIRQEVVDGEDDDGSARQGLPPRVAAEDILLQSSSSSPANESTSPSNSLLNKEEARTLQWATTGLAILFVAVAVLTVLAMDQYRLVVMVGLMLIILSFYLLLRVVRHVTENPTVLHPAVHHWMKAVRTEYRNFVEDWRKHVLLLTYHDENSNGSEHEPGSPYRDMDDPLSKESPSSHSHNRRRPKSRIFRALVHPLAPWLSRRRERRQQKRQDKQQQQQQDQEQDEEPSIELQQQKKPTSSRRLQRKQQRSAGDKGRLDDLLYVPPDYALV